MERHYNKFKSIREIVDYASDAHGERIAFQIKEKNGKDEKYRFVSYKELGNEVRFISQALIERGFKGKTIALMGDNCYEWILIYLSAIYIGCVIVPIDRALKLNEVENLISRSEPSLFAYMGNTAEDFCEGRDDFCKITLKGDGDNSVSGLISQGKSLVESGKKDYENIDIDINAMSALLFTSGTTSQSKAVMLSQYNIASNVNDLTESEKFYKDDVNLALLPLHHTFGMVALILFLSIGMKNVFCEKLRVAKALNEYRVTVLVAVPLIIESVYRQIKKEAEKGGKWKILNNLIKVSNVLRKAGIDLRKTFFSLIHSKLGGGLRFIISGGAGISPQLEKWFNDIGILTVNGYGLTETSPVVCAENDTHLRYGSVGIPMNSVEVKIDNPDENGIGEIIVKGPNVMLGYYNAPELTNDVIKDGYFHTGDLGKIDKDGYIYITGRKKDVIVLSNGKNVFPEETEQLISNLPYVLENMVFNECDDLLSVNIVYDKSYFENMEIDEIREKIEHDVKSINGKLISYKRVKKIYITDEPMIKTSTAKIKRAVNVEKILQMNK